MEEVKKWSVTYTKHINQKRKVYQDGVLELHCSNGTDKVLLFDESEKLLGSKFLKKGELVESGETLTFEGYLVDIGDLEKTCNASSDLDLEEIKKPTPNFDQLRRKTAGNSSSLAGNGMSGFRNNIRFVRHIVKKENEKNSLGKNVVLTNRPSLRYNIKKESDNSCSRNRTTLENHPSETNNIRSEWRALYTSQKTQKSKKYHDGVVRLVVGVFDWKQILLFDDSGKQLDSRFLKKDEVVACGATLTFDGYLVEIGDLDENCKPMSDFNIQGATKIPIENIGGLDEHKRSGPGNNVAPEYFSRSSMTRNVRRENDNSCSRNRTTLENHPSETSDIRSEWRALYTSQKTQKSKKYHDGVVRLVVGVFDRKQILLFDDSGKQLDSRFLKKDEVVACGATLTFDGYLVDVGDLEENCKPILDFNIQGATTIPKENIGGLDECKKGGSVNNVAPESFSRSSVTHNVKREWDALYTTQKTQKAKMYHDGILQLLVGVSHRKQVILLNEDGTILSSRYLSSSEDVRTGSKLELANHLVEIGEAKNSEEGDTENRCTSVLGAASCSTVSYVDRTKFNSSGIRPYEPLSNSSSGKTLSSYPTSVTVEKDKFSRSGIRDVNQILSSLKRPVGESICPVKEPDNLENLSIGSTDQDVRHRSEVSQSEDIEELSTSCLENGGEQQQPKPSSGISFGLTESNHPTSQTVVQSTVKPVSSMAQLQVSDDMPEQLQNLNKLVPSDEFEVFDGNSIQDAPDGNTKQFSADKMQTETNCERVDLGFLSSIGSGSCSNGSDKENSKVFTEEVKERAHLKDFPSFDLGFSP